MHIFVRVQLLNMLLKEGGGAQLVNIGVFDPRRRLMLMSLHLNIVGGMRECVVVHLWDLVLLSLSVT